jgi:hypothetical protein
MQLHRMNRSRAVIMVGVALAAGAGMMTTTIYGRETEVIRSHAAGSPLKMKVVSASDHVLRFGSAAGFDSVARPVRRSAPTATARLAALPVQQPLVVPAVRLPRTR